MKWMNAFRTVAQRIATLTPNVRPLQICVALFLGAITTACGAETVKWKEEVLLHDGSKIIVARTAKFGGGAHEPGGNSIGGY